MNGMVFPVYLALFHVCFIILMGIFAEYKFENGEDEVPNLYAMFMDVHTMMFIGFGFLMTFLKRYGFGSVGFNFLVAAYVLEWSLLVRGWLDSGLEGHAGFFEIKIENLLVSDFCAAAVLISFGAVIGKASLSQLIVMATIEVVIQSVNEFIGINYIKAYDIGESIYVHVFGAYFGLAVAKVLQHKKEVESKKEGSNYHSDLFSMIGTIFLWLYWPSFNSAVAKDEGQLRAVVNTFLSISASCITTFIASLIVGKGKLNMVHIQNATLAGGVAVGAIADMVIEPFGAMIIGTVAGLVSTLGFKFLTPFLNHHFVHDTCGVNNLHGMPGLISGITSGIVAAVSTRAKFNGNRLYEFYPSRVPVFNSTEYLSLDLANTTYAEGGLGRSGPEQGGYQIAALVLTLTLAIGGGILTGFIIRLPMMEQIEDLDDMFDDTSSWETPEDFTPTTYMNSVENKQQPHHIESIQTVS